MPLDLVTMSVELAKAHVARNDVPHHALPQLIRDIHATLVDLAAAEPQVAPSTRAGAPGNDQRMLPGIEPPRSEDRTADATERGMRDHLVAPIKQRDISSPAFDGLEPWLAQRISPSLASRLNRNPSLHPTVFPDRLICLEDGKEVKLLRPYVERRFGLTFAQYVEKWNLPVDYPPANPSYLEQKRAKAKANGLGTTTRARRERKASGRKEQGAPVVDRRKPRKAKGGDI